MYRYYVNKHAQRTGEHEVHTSLCGYRPQPDNCIYLGEFKSCQGAIAKAREYYADADGCYFCCRECHSR
ncbi:hypothetical protein BerOc1_00698 [Pseudodesulfovibrio hydrargyri]|uniref:Uncharacterized protein n=1 Tax=Pseudodesulfovibrio hydrargyri TaxID=2125990 RepID=A0A1J5NBM5_9BACT|nr:hypothetical protein [Pseudodesulfovibrio hydrargyri]OIQ52224.1 hypothetical protein BerOc1_00698 [Pseudodesulfovibrio hydrargyri]